MSLLRKYFLLLLLPVIFGLTACKKDDNTTTPTPAVNESEILVKYLQDNGDFLNSAAPAIAPVEEVRNNQLSKPDKIYIIDIRSAADFAKGHIAGAVNVTTNNIVTHIKGITATNYEKIYLVCYSGQTAGYATALLRLLGYSNVFDVKWGMSAWNDSITASAWKTAVGNNYSGFVTTATSKNVTGTLPVLTTGKTTGKEILEARITQLLSATDPFGDIKTTYKSVTDSLSKYYIVNYWPANHYGLGHIPGATQYTPKADLKDSTFLKTLPTNKPIVVYCYTGQTSAQVATILKVLGYDAKTMLYGVSTMKHDLLVANNLSKWVDSECKYYPYVK
ncbi:MAG: rhodanese-like domain-containing protein [Ignavibacteriales bacterium]|nr:rhodanese-like domain-containing protein [Ignavibacteriales bacterium]